MPKTQISTKYVERLTHIPLEEISRLGFHLGIDIGLDNHTMEIETTAERPDLLAAEGLVRAVENYRTSTPRLYQAPVRRVEFEDVNIGPKGFIAKGDFDPLFLEEMLRFFEKVNHTYGRNGRRSSVYAVGAELAGEKVLVGERSSSIFIGAGGSCNRTADYLMSIVACNFIDYGAQVTQVQNQEFNPLLQEKKIVCDVKKIQSICGTTLEEKNIQLLLKKTGLQMDGGVVKIPPYRVDVLSYCDVAGDLIVAIGIDSLMDKPTSASEIKGIPLKRKKIAQDIANVAQRLGFVEVKNTILTSEDLLKEFGTLENAILAADAKSKMHSVCRTSVQPSVLEILSKNTHLTRPLKIYEIGDSVVYDTDIRETTSLAFAVLDMNASFSFAKAVMCSLYKGREFEIQELKAPQYIDGRAASMLINGCLVGHFGEVHPRLLNALSIGEPVCTGEIGIREIV